MKFIGRQEELQSLKKLVTKKSASLVVIKGRRRVGKSRLLEEFATFFTTSFVFSGLAPTKLTTAQSQRDEFAGQLLRQTHSSNFSKNDWGDLFWELSKYTQAGSTLVVLDEISWMGNEDPDFLGKLKNAWDLYLKKNDKLILAICGSSSIWIDKNILSSTGFLGRESLTLQLDELSLYECAEFWNAENTRVSSHEKLKVLAVTGGIPRYLEEINPVLSAEDNIRFLAFTKSGILFNEFEKIFSDLFSERSALYKKIVSCLADGLSDQKTICDAIGMKLGGDISEYLTDLSKSGFISRDTTWNIRNGTTSNLIHYRLKDNYSRFYLKYILPYRQRIEAGDMAKISLATLPGWHSIMGLQVENLVLSNRHLIKQTLEIHPNEILADNPFFQRKTTKQSGCQIDYLIQTQHNTVYICEIRYSKNPIDTKIIGEVKEKIKRLSLPKRFSYRTVLIHVNGVSESVEDSQFFSYIINLTDLFSK
ncbi:MAG: AAA family ATPase [Verrucomicrobia bacterium]|nr:AAA family ATPase [Verrucomicrobiota bacterium]